MSAFVLKLLALIAMLIDHIAYVFGWEGWDLLPVDASTVRYIGRLSFPLFALCIVNGWKHTSNKEKYFTNLCVCALLSQIPFSMAFYMPNRMAILSSSQPTTFVFNPICIVLALVCGVTYWYFGLHRKASKSLIAFLAVCLLPVVYLKINYVWILSDSLNVLYTFVFGIAGIFVIDSIKSKSFRWWEYIWLIGVFVLGAVVYCPIADYGNYMMGLLLIIALYATQKWRILQSMSIAIWGCVLYGIIIGNWYNALTTLAPAVLMLFYNQKPGLKTKFSKQLFYVFYPAHLMIIGLVNIFLRLN